MVRWKCLILFNEQKASLEALAEELEKTTDPFDYWPMRVTGQTTIIKKRTNKFSVKRNYFINMVEQTQK
jgi:hypothetical protein